MNKDDVLTQASVVHAVTARWTAAVKAREAHIDEMNKKSMAIDAEVAATYQAKLAAEKKLIEEAAK